jgi:hypothetical protein
VSGAVRQVLVLAAACAVTACASAPYERHRRAGDVVAAMQAFEADSGAQRNPHALRRMARLFAEPAEATWAPDTALSLFERADSLGGRSTRRDAELQALLRAFVRADTERQAIVVQLARELDSRRAAQEALARRVEVLSDSAVRRAAELASLRELASRLERELRLRDQRLADLRTALEGLKEIDLRPGAPSTGQSGRTEGRP